MDPTLIQIPVNAPGALEFNLQRDALWMVLQVVTLAVPALMLWTGASAGLRSMISRWIGDRPTLTWILVAVTFLTISALAVLPVAYVLEIAHRAQWGRPVDDLATWLATRGIGLLIQIVAVAILAWPFVMLLKRLPATWWIFTSVVIWLAISSTLVIEQVWVRPMLQPIQSMAIGPIKSRFDEIAHRCHAGEVPVYVGGTESGGTVVGVGATTRLLMAKSEIERAENRESLDDLVGTMAHELAHYVFDDPLLALGVAGALIGMTAFLVFLLGHLTIRIFSVRLGFNTLADPAAVPLLLMIATFGWTFLASPILMAVQRNVEMRADRFALEVTRDSAARIRVLLREAAEYPFRINEYYWFFENFRATHPSHADRVRLALMYKPWETKQPGVATMCSAK